MLALWNCYINLSHFAQFQFSFSFPEFVLQGNKIMSKKLAFLFLFLCDNSFFIISFYFVETNLLQVLFYWFSLWPLSHWLHLCLATCCCCLFQLYMPFNSWHDQYTSLEVISHISQQLDFFFCHLKQEFSVPSSANFYSNRKKRWNFLEFYWQNMFVLKSNLFILFLVCIFEYIILFLFSNLLV